MKSGFLGTGGLAHGDSFSDASNGERIAVIFSRDFFGKNDEKWRFNGIVMRYSWDFRVI